MAAGKYKTDQNYDDDIEFIKDTDPVQGDPAGTDPENSPLTGGINVVIQKIVGSLAYLKDAIDNATIARMTDSVFGTGRTATQNEAETGTAHGQGGPLLSVLRGMQLLRGSAAQATVTRRGTAEIASATEAVDENNTTHMLNPQRGFTLLRSSQAQATESQRGTVRRASQSQARALTDTERYLSVALLLDTVRNASGLRASESNYGVARRANQAEVNAGVNTEKFLTPDTFNDSDAIQGIRAAATASVSTSSGTWTVRSNIVIGSLLYLEVENTGNSNSNGGIWTISGGTWRIISATNRKTELNSSMNLRTILENSNNTTFQLQSGISIPSNAVINIIAILR